MKKQSYFKDSIGAMVFILLSIYGLSKIEINSDIFNPISKVLGDFRLTDVVFSYLRERPKADTNIVMVNIGPSSIRGRIDHARLINIINHYEPKVIGIDAFFRKSKGDSIDGPLVEAFSKVKHLVLVSELFENDSSDISDSMDLSNPKFMQYAEPGFADMITKSKFHFKTSRECTAKEKVRRKGKSDTIYYSFPVKMASIYDPAKAKAFVDRNKNFEIINFQGNIDLRTQDVADNAKNVFFTLDWTDVEDTLFDPSVIKDKIVIIGYLGDNLGDNKWEDKFFTPLNANYIGKSNPDMYGVVVHANIVSMILKGDFINEMPEWINMLGSIILIFFNVWFFTYLYRRTEEWYDGLSNVITIGMILVLIGVVLFVFDYYSYIVDITLPSVALFLTGNLIEIYYGILSPSIQKVGRKVPFLKNI